MQLQNPVEETGSPVDLFDAERLLTALLAWTVVGVLFTGLLLGAGEILSAYNLVPRLTAVLLVFTESLSLGLVLAGWGLGVVAICMLAGIRAVMRKPVVLPWTERLFAQQR